MYVNVSDNYLLVPNAVLKLMCMLLTLPSSILLYEFYIKAGSMYLKICYCSHYLMWLVLLLLCGHKWDGSFYENSFCTNTMMNNLNLFGCLLSLFWSGSLVCNTVGLHNSLLFTIVQFAQWFTLYNNTQCL